MEHVEAGKELTLVLVLSMSGVLAGFLAPTWTALAIVALVVGIVVNGWLLISAAAKSHPDRMHLAAMGSVPAGLYDAAKIFLIGAVVRGIVSLAT